MSLADELLKYKELLEGGAITQEEFDKMKAKILGEQTQEATNDIPQKKTETSSSNVSQFGTPQYQRTKYDGGMSKKNANKTNTSRKGMKIAEIVCAVFAVIYLLMTASIGTAMLGMVVFFGILAFMFFKLSKIPKSYKHIGIEDRGMKKNFFVILCIVISFIAVGVISGTFSSGESNSNTKQVDTVNTTVSEEISDSKTETESEEPTMQFANDFEKTLYDAVTNNNGTVTSIYFEGASDSNNQTAVEYVEFYCENNEEVVQEILNQLLEAQKADATVAVCAVIKEAEDSTSNIVIADIDAEGNLEMTFESPKYNSARNNWISGQFSAWDGSHTELTKLIKQNLNDEKSYDHSGTTYRDIKTQSDADEINKILSDAGYSAQVEIGDLFIMTEFSAKNAFNATVKNTAFGIASYDNNTIQLVGIE